eukprot:8088407-Pyramimonas_sp.AAC.1
MSQADIAWSRRARAKDQEKARTLDDFMFARAPNASSSYPQCGYRRGTKVSKMCCTTGSTIAFPASRPICRADPTGRTVFGSIPCILNCSSARKRRLWDVTQKPAPRDHVRVGEKSW